jgi:hypothetical protein
LPEVGGGSLFSEQSAASQLIHRSIRLGRNARCFQVLSDHLDAGREAEAAALCESMERFVADDAQTRRMLLMARVRMLQGQAAEAAEMLIAIGTAADSDLAAEALYYCGQAHEQLHRPDVAIGLYRDVVKHALATADIRARATTRLADLSPNDGG